MDGSAQSAKDASSSEADSHISMDEDSLDSAAAVSAGKQDVVAWLKRHGRFTEEEMEEFEQLFPPGEREEECQSIIYRLWGMLPS